MTKEDIKQICQIYDNFRSERDVATIAYNSDDTFWEHILATYNLSQSSLPSNLDEAAKKWKEENFRREYYQIPKDAMSCSFKAGAEWQYQKDRGEFAKIKAKTWCEGFDAHKKQKEQKPAEWSEEDEEMLNSCISSIEESKENRYAYKETDGDTSYDYEIAWLKSLRPSWKPSEHQMSMLLAVINDPNNAGSESCHLSFKSLYNDLKKL